MNQSVTASQSSPTNLDAVSMREVEALIAEYPCVEQVAVVDECSADGALERVAYFATEGNCSIALPPLAAYLGRSFEASLLPVRFEQREKLPLTADGTVDREALLGGTTATESASDTAAQPMTEIEERVLAVVRETINIPTVSLGDNFFDVGGHSLLGTQFVLRARKVFGVKITLRDVFEAETVGELAARIESLILEEIDALSEQEASQLSTERVA